MILHRLRLNNFRGVQDREICFPAHGVVVVCGPNEIGKSSMLEALDLLLTYRDRSNHRDVKQVKPANADVGAQVEAEISTGSYRFVYRKRFHKRHMTELDVIAPKREHLTGDEAHERVEAMLSETVDTKLWDAQRVLQSASTTAVNLSGSDALARALDAAAGDAAASPTGGDSLLIDRIDDEFERYFTRAAGKPTKEWKAAIDRVNCADAEVSRCRDALAEVDERVGRHEQLTAALQDLQSALGPAEERLAAARAAHTVLAELADQVAQARLTADSAAAKSASSAMNNGLRQQLITDAERRAATVLAVQDQLAVAEQQEASTRQVFETAAKSAEQAVVALAAAQLRFDTARATAQSCVARDAAAEEAERLAARLRRIDDAETSQAQLDGQLATITLTGDIMADIDAYAEQVDRLHAQLRATAGAVEFIVAADLPVVVDGQPRTLTVDQPWLQPASSAVTVDVPGVLTVRIDPGASAVKLHEELLAAQRLLDAALERGGVADVAAARKLDDQRCTLIVSRGQVAAALAALRDGDDVPALRARLAQLRNTLAQGTPVDAEAAAAELASADEGLRAARAGTDIQQPLVAAATAEHNAKATAAALLRDRLTAANSEFAIVCEQLTTLRAAVPDEAVAALATADAEALRQAADAVAALAQEYAAHDPDAVAAELAAASSAVIAMTVERDAAQLAMRDLNVELAVIGNEGRQGQLDEALAERERAGGAFARVQERAGAAQLLRDTMIRHRDNTRQRYVRPYRAELERLGRVVFGASFEVDVDTELTIQTRTLDGCTVPYASLSGGAKEQLGILARLAGAALVAKEDTVPVIIDDALGFSDPDRLVKMGAVLNSLGDRGQVIVLTCTPGRYDGVADAEVIELSA